MAEENFLKGLFKKFNSDILNKSVLYFLIMAFSVE